MMSFKRILLVTVSATFLMAGSAVAASKNPRPCGPPKGFTAFLYKVGLTSGKFAPCETTPADVSNTGVLGEWCAQPGKHCNNGEGSGKCASYFVAEEAKWMCTCEKNGGGGKN
jgi:hypothetical protein